MSKDYVLRLSTLPMHATVGGSEGGMDVPEGSVARTQGARKQHEPGARGGRPPRWVVASPT
jgi:hypothetical protein